MMSSKSKGSVFGIILFTIIYSLAVFEAGASDIVRTDTLLVNGMQEFTRDIKSHKFIDHKTVIGGISFNYFKFDSDNSKILFGVMNNINYDASIFGVSPYIGYSFKDNQIVGMKVNYSRYYVNLDKLKFNMGDAAVSLGDMKFKQNVYGISLFYRSYIGLDKEQRFGFFSEINTSAYNGDSYFITGRGDNTDTYKTRINTFDIGMSPGISVFVHRNVSFELSFNVVGFNYDKYVQSLNGKPKGKMEKSGANFRINPFNMNISLTLCI